MNHWRMSMRWGSDGQDFFPECRSRGIASLGYYDAEGQPIVQDCRELTPEEFDEAWRAKGPRRTVARNAMRSLAYEVKQGDIIYARSSPYIVARGEVTDGYAFDPDIMAGTDCRWEHFVRVAWVDLSPFKVAILPAPPALLKLEDHNLGMMLAAVGAEAAQREASVRHDLDTIKLEDEYTEGQRTTRLVSHFERNGDLRSAAVAIHGTRCQVCGLSFAEVYGPRGEDYIEAHHIKPVASYKGEVTVDPATEMAVVCSNCHRMLHRVRDEPLTIDELRKIVEGQRQVGR